MLLQVTELYFFLHKFIVHNYSIHYSPSGEFLENKMRFSRDENYSKIPTQSILIRRNIRQNIAGIITE